MVEIDKIDVYYSSALLDNLNDSFRRSMNKIIDNLVNIFTESIRMNYGSIENYISNMLDEYYLNEMHSRFRHIQNSMEEQLRYQVDMLKKKVAADPADKKNALYYFQEEVDRLFKTLNRDPFADINEDFISKYRSRTLSRFEELGSRTYDEIAFEIIPASKRYLTKYAEELMEQVDTRSLVNEINKVASDYVESVKVEEKPKEEEKPSVLDQTLISAAKLFDYKLELTGSSGILIDSVGRMYPVRRTTNGVVSTEKDRIELQYSTEGAVFFDPKRKQKITISSANKVKVESLDSNRTFEICKEGEEVEFIWNGKKVSQGAQKTVLMNSIKSSYPTVYSIMEKTPSMQTAFDEAKKQEQEEDFFTSDFKVNPAHREELEKRLFIAGYSLVEKEDGLYVVDTQTGVEDKLINDSNGLKLENNPDVSIAPDVTIISKNLATKCMQIRRGNGFLIISSNFEYFGYTSDKCNCNLTLDQNGMNFSGENMTQEEMQSLFTKEFPNVMEYAASNTLWEEYSIKKEKVKEENVTPQEDQVEEKTGEALLDEKIRELEMDPKVQAYLELLRLKQSLNQNKTAVDEEEPATRK